MIGRGGKGAKIESQLVRKRHITEYHGEGHRDAMGAVRSDYSKGGTRAEEIGRIKWKGLVEITADDENA